MIAINKYFCDKKNVLWEEKAEREPRPQTAIIMSAVPTTFYK